LAKEISFVSRGQDEPTKDKLNYLDVLTDKLLDKFELHAKDILSILKPRSSE
jgi:hypothetical protein